MLLTLLRRLTDAALADAIAGDLEEAYRRRAAEAPVRARVWHAAAAAGILVHVAFERSREVLMNGFAARFGLHGLGREVLQAGRSLGRTPVSSAVVVLMLALGLGMNTAIFSVVHGVLFQPLPFPEPDRLVVIEGREGGREPTRYGTSYHDFVDLRAHQRTFDDMATSTYWTFTVTGLETPRRLVGARVSGTFFPMLGARPLIGRTIEPSDNEPGADNVAVLSYGLWMRVLGGQPDVIGRTLIMNGVSTRIVGVMPASFRFPSEDMELWAGRLHDELSSAPRNSRFFVTIGRLRPEVSVVAAEEDLLAITEGLEREFPDAYRDWRPVVTPALAELTADARPQLTLLFAAVVTVLVLACVNVATLLVSRGAARAREFAVRAALGAGGWRLVRVTLLESAWLGSAGLAAGLALAVPAVVWLRSLAPPEMPRLDNVALGWPILGWASIVMLASVLAGGLAPFVSLRRTQAASLRAGATAGPARGGGRRALVALQVAAAFALLIATGLLVRSFSQVLAVEPGFNPSNLALVRVFLTPPTYRSTESQIQYVTRALDALAHTPGVVSAAAVSQPPFDSEGAGTVLTAAIEGREYQPGTQPSVHYRTASPSYFSTVGMRVLQGRGIEVQDRADTQPVAVVNETMARQLWPGEDAIGRRFTFAESPGSGPLTVVGVVNDVATNGLEERERPTVYAPYVQRSIVYLRWMTLVVRTAGDADRQLATVRSALQALDPNQPLYAETTMAQTMARSVADRRFAVTLMTSFAALTLLLAMLGLYGALAQRVTERHREIGVRLAVGARPAEVFRLVVGDGLRVVTAGIVLGAALAMLIGAQVEALLFGVRPFDGLTYGAAIVLLAGVGCLASAVPAGRASRVDPVTVLRTE